MKFTSFSISIVALSLLLQACDRGPTAGFRIEPNSNPEVGDTIKFINESIDAISYEWDFGNGSTSEEEMPFTFYNERGSYEVVLNAVNDKGNDTISKTIQINDPTVMGFLIAKPDSTPLFACNVWVYTDTASWNAFDEPEFFKLTSDAGLAEFKNMESINYYVWIFKETSEGTYFSGGYTPPLELNAENVFVVVTEFFPNEEQQSMKKSDLIPISIESRAPLKKTIQ